MDTTDNTYVLWALRDTATTLSDVRLDKVGEGSRADLAARLGALTALMATLDGWKGVLEMRLGETMPQPQEITPVGMLKREPRYSEHWDNKGCYSAGARALARDFAMDRATGEINDALEGSFRALLERMAATFSVGKPKFAAFKALGLDPENYRERESVGWKVTLVPLEPMAEAAEARAERRGSDGE